VSAFLLYRYTHPDGAAKDWAWGVVGETIVVRWGRAGQLVQQAVYPIAERPRISERARAKVAKGYRASGEVRIDAQGRPVPITGNPAESTPARTAGRPLTQPLDLARLETAGEDFWF
jgi:predicted DNA-binding WGR domain protein